MTVTKSEENKTKTHEQELRTILTTEQSEQGSENIWLGLSSLIQKVWDEYGDPQKHSERTWEKVWSRQPKHRG